MGVSVYYWAIPASSDLFRRVQTERPFAMLMARFFHQANGVYFMFEDDETRMARLTPARDSPEGRERMKMIEEMIEEMTGRSPGSREDYKNLISDTMVATEESYREGLAKLIEERPDIFGPELEARRWIDEFRQELDRTKEQYSGIEYRFCSLEKSSSTIEERLLQTLSQTYEQNPRTFLRKLMFGDRQLCAELALGDDYRLGLISSPLIHEGAKILSQIDGETLFAYDSWYLDDFCSWRQLYCDAAAEDFVLLTAAC